MNCRRINSLLSAYIDGELAGVEQLHVRQHLRVCSECDDEYQSLLNTKRLLSGMVFQTPRPGLADEILRRLEADPRASRCLPLGGWWETQSTCARQRFRAAALGAGMVTAALVVLLAVPTTPANGPVDLATLPRRDYVAAPTALPIRDLQFLHESWDPAQPTFSGGIEPVSLSTAGPPYYMPTGPRVDQPLPSRR
ncbi:MAG: zf-HC2 domain-containing protein [Chthonomonadales bacterium]|nr:zf-HC2 domain-containing protein [Chthonomonadales bacterium]